MTTLLSIVQDILSDADSDETNSIVNGTVESGQAVTVIRTIYDAIIDQYDLPSKWSTFVQTGSVVQDTQFVLDADTNRIQWIKYDITEDSATPKWETITFLQPNDFLYESHRLDKADSAVEEKTFNGAKYYIRTDRAPSSWTTFDDKSIIFNSYNSDAAVDPSGLQPNKLQGFGLIRPALVENDTAEIDLPDELIGLLRNESRELFFDLYKDGATRKIIQLAERSRVRAGRNRHKFPFRQPEEDSTPNYGRKSGSGRSSRGSVNGTGGVGLPDWWPS